MAKHTPGPWKTGRGEVKPVLDRHLPKWIFAGDQYVAVASGRVVGPWDEVMANAWLIAAAPDLLAACKAFLEAETDSQRWQAKRQMEEAVARAEGTDQAAGE